jgi:hypothetical protein
MKHLLLFENFDQTMPEDLGLSSGEKAALDKGLELLTMEQAAVCYLYAKELYSEIYRAMVSAEEFAPSELSTENPDDLSILIGIKRRSFDYAVSKMKILLGLIPQGSQAIYPKIINFFNQFSEMGKDGVINIASGAFTPDAMEKGKAFKYQLDSAKAQKSTETINMNTLIRDAYKAYYRMAMGRMDDYQAKLKAVENTIKKLAEKGISITPSEVRKVVSSI